MTLFRVRSPTADDAPALADEAFTVTDGAWFCFVVEDEDGDLVAFAKGHAARWSVSSMLLFGDASNPSNGFYEASLRSFRTVPGQ